ncbi:Uncharacterized protein dnm_011780 [Desulfonema magnum]|uniref:Uncharacterized protein n=1 Tax=Desulfonema magnum TaxID=45655 RepID=A0A975BH27_9BACT|nr:Uncharacterized protein dnm_011780 [Desulfonema magnum]
MVIKIAVRNKRIKQQGVLTGKSGYSYIRKMEIPLLKAILLT